MNNGLIYESGMTFGPYPEGHCFCIEKSQTLKKLKGGIKMAEFLMLQNKHKKPALVWVVEAKSSSPRPENRMDFDGYIDEIKEKLTNALMLGLAACLKRHPAAEAELPDPFKRLDLTSASFRLVLVINGHPEEWLKDLQDALVDALRVVVKTWALSPSSVAVINDRQAVECGLIISNQS